VTTNPHERTAAGYTALWPMLEPVIASKQPDRWSGPKENDGWLTGFHSPLRPDKHPSFAVKPDSENSPGAFKDFGTNDKGSIADLAKRLGVDPRVSGNGQAGTTQSRRIIATYDYIDLDGRSYQSVRYEPKDFRQRQGDDRGGWIWNLKGIRPNLYRRDEIDAADPTEPVLYCEGEKDADAARARGFIATTHAMGAGKFQASYRDALAGHHVVLLEDNDDAGREHVSKGAAFFHGAAASIRIVRFPNLPDHGDLSDWLAAGGTAEALRTVIEQTPLWTPPARQEQVHEEQAQEEQSAPRRGVRICLADVQPEEITWLWPGRIPYGKITLLVGDPGLGKSFLSLYLASRLSTGSALQGETERPPRIDTLLLSAEDDLADTIRPRLDRMGADVNRISAFQGILETDEDGRDIERMVRLDTDLAELERQIEETGARFVVVDPINAYLGKTDGNQDIDLRRVLNPLAIIAARHKVAMLVVTHSNKRSEGNKLHRVMGSLAFVGLARSVLAVGADPDVPGRCNMVQIKNNLAAHAPGLGYRIIAGEVVWDSDPVSLTADTVFDHKQSAPPAVSDAMGEAITFLQTALEQGPRKAKEIDHERRELGITDSTFKRAKAKLGITSTRVGGAGSAGYWIFEYPKPEEPPVAPDMVWEVEDDD